MNAKPRDPGSGRASTTEPQGYFLAHSLVTDSRRFEQFRSVMTRLREVHKGTTLIQAQPVTSIIGAPVEGVVSLVEFPSISHLRRLLNDPEHVALAERLRPLAPGPTWVAIGVLPAPIRPVQTAEPFAYAIARFELADPNRLQTVKGLVGELVAKNGGRFLVRAQSAENLVGASDGWRLSIVEFDSRQQLHTALNSRDFQDMIKLSLGHGARTLWTLQGRMPLPPGP